MVISRQQTMIRVMDSRLMDEAQSISPKDLSALMPNVYMPNYGSSMTSSIYIRGLGSRINEPVMGMVIDGIPIMDKNLYHFKPNARWGMAYEQLEVLLYGE